MNLAMRINCADTPEEIFDLLVDHLRTTGFDDAAFQLSQKGLLAGAMECETLNCHKEAVFCEECYSEPTECDNCTNEAVLCEDCAEDA